ncbi:MAG TPA: phytanoyl-CoA dioxygenase family protein [Chloroflexota bacterium]|nr:phytanoyl-CoA dioxygenase family protein [Chloroflexota bacterium]
MVAVGERAPRVVSRGQELELAPEAFGELRRSDDLVRPRYGVADVERRSAALRERMAEDGYVFLPGYLDRAEVLDARRAICSRLAELGLLRGGDATYPVEEGIVVPGASLAETGMKPADIAARCAELQHLLYGYDGRLMRFHRAFLGGDVKHYDFTWLRVVRPGKGTTSHCDIVFMGRGTSNLYTAWTPLGDIDRTLGGLIVLEGSHKKDDLRDYQQTDVDTYCENKFDGAWVGPEGQRNRPELATGGITEDHVGLRRRMGGRWLTTDFRMGDLLVFGMFLVHASLDNQSADRLRLSSDSRYQLASEPADERWIGPQPPGHGPQSGRGVIC